MAKTTAKRVAIIGGGMAGLGAAAYLARAGAEVTLMERAATLGGRAATTQKGDWSLNLGPHALYVKGAGTHALQELGVEISGHVPGTKGTYAVDGDRLRTLPIGFVSLLTTGLFGLGTKLEVARILAGVARLPIDELHDISASDWLADLGHPEARQFMAAMFRLTTYIADHDRVSAAAVLGAVQLAAAGNVYYVDGGWQSLVDGLAAAATQAGACIVTGKRVEQIEPCPGGGWQVRMAGAASLHVDAVVIAAAPHVAAKLVRGSAASTLQRWADDAVPVRAACLDIALRSLPNPKALFGLGIDTPTYMSVHSATASLAPENAATVHALRYLRGDSEPDRDRAQLETLMDRMQPGWRDHVEHVRFLPSMTVSHGIPRVGTRRPGPDVPDADGLFVVGDWVGAQGINADACLASARAAATAISVERTQAIEELPVTPVRAVVA